MVRIHKGMLGRALGYFLINFATPVAFYLCFHWFGPKPAIRLAIGVTLAQVLVHRILRLKFSPFFLLASGFVIAFGLIDLFVHTPRFFRLEPFFQNWVLATILLATSAARVPLLFHLAMALPGRLRPDFGQVEGEGHASRYYRKMTWVVALYLYLKGALFLYLAFHVDLGTLILFRSIFGSATLALMIAAEFFYRRQYIRKLPKKLTS